MCYGDYRQRTSSGHDADPAAEETAWQAAEQWLADSRFKRRSGMKAALIVFCTGLFL